MTHNTSTNPIAALHKAYEDRAYYRMLYFLPGLAFLVYLGYTVPQPAQVAAVVVGSSIVTVFMGWSVVIALKAEVTRLRLGGAFTRKREYARNAALRAFIKTEQVRTAEAQAQLAAERARVAQDSAVAFAQQVVALKNS